MLPIDIFQVFLLTVVFGLFHGLIFLPVILTILGPTSKDDELSKYESSDVTQTTDNDLVTSSNGDVAKTVNLVAGGGLDNPAFVNENKEVIKTSFYKFWNNKDAQLSMYNVSICNKTYVFAFSTLTRVKNMKT